MGGSGALCGAMEDLSTLGHVVEKPGASSRSVALARFVARATVLASLDNWMDATRPDDLQREPTELSRCDCATGINALTWSAPPPARLPATVRWAACRLGNPDDRRCADTPPRSPRGRAITRRPSGSVCEFEAPRPPASRPSVGVPAKGTQPAGSGDSSALGSGSFSPSR